MKLQKLYPVLLGLALLAPHVSLNAKIPTPALGSTSWSKSLLGSLAWLGAAPVKLPMKTLNLCYQYPLVTVVGLAAAYWGYTWYVQPLWRARKDRLAQEAPDYVTQVKTFSKDPGTFQRLKPELQEQHLTKLQSHLVDQSFTERFCSWIPSSAHDWLHNKFGLTRGKSAHYFFDAVRAAKNMTITRNKTTNVIEDLSKHDHLSQQQLNVLRILSYGDRPEDAVSDAYKTRAASALGQKVFGKDEVSVTLPLVGTETQQA